MAKTSRVIAVTCKSDAWSGYRCFQTTERRPRRTDTTTCTWTKTLREAIISDLKSTVLRTSVSLTLLIRKLK